MNKKYLAQKKNDDPFGSESLSSRKDDTKTLDKSDKHIDIVNKSNAKAEISGKEITNAQSEWFILSESAIGALHKKHGTPCQDSYYVKKINQQWGVAVVSDGLSSKTHSDIGSDFVAKKPQKYSLM